MFYLPTLEECFEICANNESFIHKTESINGEEVTQFNYMLAMPEDFRDPLKEGFNTFKGRELRGLTFVGEKRYLMLHKFHNVNETVGYLESELKEMDLVSVRIKEDGSVIRFVDINGKVHAKSKYSFFSPQALAAQKIYEEDERIKNAVDFSLPRGLALIFEYVSPDNIVVLTNYTKPELRLLQIRDEETGSYLPAEAVKDFCASHGIPCAEDIENETFENLLEKRLTEEEMEGWVLHFRGGHLAKLKTEWYIERHRRLTGAGFHANNIVKSVLKEEIDDLVSGLPEHDPRVNMVHEIQEVISKHVNHTVHEIFDIITTFDEERWTPKTLAENYKTHPFFKIIARTAKSGCFDEEAVLDMVKERVEYFTMKKERAEEYLKQLGAKYETVHSVDE